MAQTIQIKRSTGTGKPTNVAQGELFYAYGSGSTYGKRLAIGHVDGGGNTPEIIGGKYFTDLLDVTAGTVTASKVIIVDSNSAVNELKIKAQGLLKLQDSAGGEYVALKAPASVGSNVTYTLPAAAVNGNYLQTNGSGVLSWAALSTALTVGADSGSDDTITVGTDTLDFVGTANEVETTVSNNTITIGLPNNVTIGGNATVTGDLTVNGTTTTLDTATLSVEDPLIILASGNNAADSVDIGLYGLYDTSGSQDLYGGLFRDANDSGKWKLFKDNQEAPSTTVNTSGTGYAVATLVANIEAASATLTTAAISGGTITGITDLAIADGGTGRGTFTSNGILYGNGTTGLLATAAGTDGYFLYSNSGTPAWTNAVDGGTF